MLYSKWLYLNVSGLKIALVYKLISWDSPGWPSQVNLHEWIIHHGIPRKKNHVTDPSDNKWSIVLQVKHIPRSDQNQYLNIDIFETILSQHTCLLH